jgi:hypothetical protein
MHKVMHKNKIYKLSHGTNAHKKTTSPKMVIKQIIAFYFVAALILQLFFGRVTNTPEQTTTLSTLLLFAHLLIY